MAKRLHLVWKIVKNQLTMLPKKTYIINYGRFKKQEEMQETIEDNIFGVLKKVFKETVKIDI